MTARVARGLMFVAVVAGVLAGCSDDPPRPDSAPTRTPPSSLPTPTPSVSPAFGREGVAGLRGTPPPRARIGEAGGANAATRLSATPGCEGARSIETLTWRPASRRGSEQRVAVSVRSDGFETGTYRMSSALPAAENTYRLRDIQPGGVYYWRVLTKHGNRYDASEIDTFEARPCTVDS